MAGHFDETPSAGIPSAAPSSRARLVALLAIGLAGTCGGLIGYAVTDLQCSGGCPTMAGVIGLGGATIAAAGVGVVSVLSLRAMAEWRASSRQQAARDHHPVD